MQSTAGGWGGACRAASFRVLASSLPNDAGGCKYCAWERFFLGAASMAAHRGGAGLGCHPGPTSGKWAGLDSYSDKNSNIQCRKYVLYPGAAGAPG
jgi:hypothetical protein